MSYIFITGSRKQKINLPNGYDLKKIKIGIPANEEKKELVNLKNIGDIILPSGKFGNKCKRNAYGYTYPDKTKPKERRYVSTVWIYPYGNENASPIACDIYRECYPVINVPPTYIELMLFEDENDKQYIIANITTELKSDYLLDTVNIFLEIFGECYIYSDELSMNSTIKKVRCNWEILPPGEKPSVHLIQQLQKHEKKTDTYDVARLKILEKCDVETIVEGTNGFEGYYAFICQKCCVLESAFYGNATYIIPKQDWDILSQKTKQELINEKNVIKKIIHTEKWEKEIEDFFRNY